MMVDSIAAGLWLILFLGVCFVMWRMGRRVQVLEVRLADVEESKADVLHFHGQADIVGLTGDLAIKDIEIAEVRRRQDDRE